MDSENGLRRKGGVPPLCFVYRQWRQRILAQFNPEAIPKKKGALSLSFC